MQRYKIIIEYCGTDFCGSAKQKNTNNTVEECIENAIRKLTREAIFIYFSGRTDSGVHALGQVAHFDLQKNMPIQNIVNGINFYLSQENRKISILSAEKVSFDFHARFSAKQRYYRYLILTRNSPTVIKENRIWHINHDLDLNSMKKASEIMIGEHDFSSFRSKGCTAKRTVRNISYINIEKNQDEISIEVASKGFLYNQVRIIVGTLVKIGMKKWSPQIIENILREKNRQLAGPTAPAYGLYFLKIDY